MYNRDGDYLKADEARWAWDAYRQELREREREGARIERMQEELRDAVKLHSTPPVIVPAWRRGKRLVPSVQFECDQVAAAGALFETGINGVFDNAQGQFDPTTIAQKCAAFAPAPVQPNPQRTRPDDVQCPAGAPIFCPKSSPIYNPLDQACYATTNFVRSAREGWKTTRSIRCE
jgi:hypothetical protein